MRVRVREVGRTCHISGCGLSQISAYSLLSAYYLATQSDKRIHSYYYAVMCSCITLYVYLTCLYPGCKLSCIHVAGSSHWFTWLCNYFMATPNIVNISSSSIAIAWAAITAFQDQKWFAMFRPSSFFRQNTTCDSRETGNTERDRCVRWVGWQCEKVTVQQRLGWEMDR